MWTVPLLAKIVLAGAVYFMHHPRIIKASLLSLLTLLLIPDPTDIIVILPVLSGLFNAGIITVGIVYYSIIALLWFIVWRYM